MLVVLTLGALLVLAVGLCVLGIWAFAGRVGARKLLAVAPCLFVGYIVYSLFVNVVLHEGDFYRSRGDFDSDRIPLSYPYELRMVDDLSDGAICRWGSGSVVLGEIVAYQRCGRLIAGKTVERKLADRAGSARARVEARVGWFVFDMESGEVERLESEDRLVARLKSIGGFAELRLRSVRECYHDYWKG